MGYVRMVCGIVVVGGFLDGELKMLKREMCRSLYFSFGHSGACTTHVYANTPHSISKSGSHAQKTQPW